MKGSQNWRRIVCKFIMKQSDETVDRSTYKFIQDGGTFRMAMEHTCIPARFLLRLMARAKYCRTASLASADARTRELKIWNREPYNP